MRVRLLLGIGVFALLVSGVAYAQGFRADVPFPFSVGDKALPAGNYLFSQSADRPAKLVVRDGQGGQVMVLVLTRLGGPTPFTDSSLVFDVSEKSKILAEVWIPGSGGLLVHNTPKDHEHQLLVGVPSNSKKLDGKTAFAQTCARCHGPEGKGNPEADKFFKVSIPRLGSEYVQTKSDQEIRDIITQGRRNMDPVRVGDPGLRHLLQLQSVDEVIAYVRTLKR
jgi:hypothetical protein